MLSWLTKSNKLELSPSIKEQRNNNQERTLAFFRIILTYLGLSFYICLWNINILTLLLLISIAIYSTIVFIFKPFHAIFSSINILTIFIDEILIFLVCLFTGGLDSPFVLIFIMPVLVFAINPIFKQLSGVILSSILAIIILGLVTGYKGGNYIYLPTFLTVVGFFVFITVNNDFKSISSYAIKDGLTGLYTHQFFFDQLGIIMSTKSEHIMCSIIMLDLDEFKQLNDTHGHLEGDRVLKLVADTIMQNVRETDIVARYGGDEFAIILPGVGYQLCKSIVERIRTAIIELGYFDDVSIGSALYPDEATKLEKLVDLADSRMYAEKKSKVSL